MRCAGPPRASSSGSCRSVVGPVELQCRTLALAARLLEQGQEGLLTALCRGPADRHGSTEEGFAAADDGDGAEALLAQDVLMATTASPCRRLASPAADVVAQSVAASVLASNPSSSLSRGASPALCGRDVALNGNAPPQDPRCLAGVDWC